MGALVNKKSPTAFMLFLIVFFILSSIVVEVAVYLLVEAGVPRAIFSSMWFMIFLQFFRLLLPLFIWLRITKDSFRAHMPNRPLDLVNIIYIFFLTLLAMPSVMLVSASMTMLTDNVAAEMMTGLTDARHPWWLLMLTIAVTPAIVEELVFRGYIQSVQRGTVLKVCVFNGFLFGLMHLNLHQFAYTFIVGIGWAYIVYITKSVWAGVWSHFIMNGSNVTLMYWATLGAEVSEEVPELTLAETMRDAFIETDPEMAQRVYEFFYGANVMVFAIIVVGIIAIPTAIGAWFVFRAFVRHNREIELRLAEKVEIEVEENEIAEEPNDDIPRKKFDWCFALVILIFVVFAFIL